MKYYSQSYQDKFVDQIILKCKIDGFFIEIGAYDGVTFSNTYFFEKSRNWNGICIEPIPSVFEKLSKNRACECINGAISLHEGFVELTHVDGPSEMLTGITNNYHNDHEKRIESELNKLGGEINNLHVKSYKLADILAERNIKKVDYCSIDVEGSELEVLNSINFHDVQFSVFSIENNYDDPKFEEFMTSNGFQLIGKLDADDIYVNNNFNDIESMNKSLIKYKIQNKLNNIKSRLFS